ncbi:ABC transporter ATP-binding protein [Actinocrispum sp. NPDC049592]|uniref:ABC transporter ATP-binding protein n=1 Tax=Actinocrispum sp. NPDC049592 TaxID=3154835 RepID=UPI003423235F
MLFRLIRLSLRDYRGPLAIVVVLQLLQTLAALYLPTLNADIIDFGVVPGDTGYIMRVGGMMLLVTLGQIVCAAGATYYAARTASAIGRDIRANIFGKVQSFSAREVGHFGTPSLITRTTNDVQQVQMLTLLTFTLMVMAPIMCVGGIILALRQDAPLSLLLVIIVPVLGTLIMLIVSRMRPWFRQMQDRIDGINRILREQITGIRVVRAFVRDKHEQERFGAANNELLTVSLRVGKLMALMFPTVMLVMNLSSVAVLWFGGMRIDSGQMQIGALTAFLSYLMQILMSVMMATFMFIMLPRAEVCAERIMEVLETEPSVAPPVEPVALPVPLGEVELANVDFSYPGAEEPVLCGVNLVAHPGQTTAIIGSTGAGKTTLINLVARLFDATGGTVRIDGVNVRDLDGAALSTAIGLVPQKAYLFTGTIRSNLQYGRPDATDEEMWRALEIAQARDFVEAMPDGLDTAVAQGGTTVSGGQRQRLAIARAIIHRPAVYLFDDCFSALDQATDARLRSALAAETANASVIVVAQRVNTIRNADRIVVLDEGRVVGTGTHHDLMESNDTYREIVLSQLTEQEAA